MTKYRLTMQPDDDYYDVIMEFSANTASLNDFMLTVDEKQFHLQCYSAQLAQVEVDGYCIFQRCVRARVTLNDQLGSGIFPAKP